MIYLIYLVYLICPTFELPKKPYQVPGTTLIPSSVCTSINTG